jgi:hypothetical protein
VSNSTSSARPRAVGFFPRLSRAAIGPGGRVRLIVLIVLLALGVAVGGHMYGRRLAFSDLAEREATIQLLQAEGEKLETKFSDQTAQLAALQAKLTGTQAALDAIMPSENTYHINPNQSLIIGDGNLTIGLIGSPTNENINLNINGKQQFAVAGDVLRVTPNAVTVCDIAIRSFDMFKAVIHASCEMAEPR